jgi:hypothetical protein
MLKTTSATIALCALTIPLTNPALAYTCASPAEAAALQTAAMQQELMVAALQCHESSAYNRFVIAYRPELQDSDAALKAFFVRRGGEHGEAGYDTFKTKAANLAALEQARDAPAFCADAHSLFQAVMANRGSLMSFVESQSTRDIGNVCGESRPSLRPVRTGDASPVTLAPVPAAAASVTIPSGADVAAAGSPRTAAIKVGDVRRADGAVGGVPSFSGPNIPWRDAAAAAPPPPDVPDAGQYQQANPAPVYATEQNVPPQTLARYYQIRNRGYGYNDYGNYAPPPRYYGPPPGWRPGWSNYYVAPPAYYGWIGPRTGYYGYYNW